MAYNDPPIVSADVLAVAELAASDLSVFIENAKAIVDSYLLEKGLADAILRRIAIYLSAHFAFLKEGQIKSEKIGDSNTTFNVTSGFGLLSTTFGQMAISLDSSGTLWELERKDKLTKNKKGSIEIF